MGSEKINISRGVSLPAILHMGKLYSQHIPTIGIVPCPFSLCMEVYIEFSGTPIQLLPFSVSDKSRFVSMVVVLGYCILQSMPGVQELHTSFFYKYGIRSYLWEGNSSYHILLIEASRHLDYFFQKGFYDYGVVNEPIIIQKQPRVYSSIRSLHINFW